jgi:hypothetical protein
MIGIPGTPKLAAVHLGDFTEADVAHLARFEVLVVSSRVLLEHDGLIHALRTAAPNQTVLLYYSIVDAYDDPEPHPEGSFHKAWSRTVGEKRHWLPREGAARPGTAKPQVPYGEGGSLVAMTEARTAAFWARAVADDAPQWRADGVLVDNVWDWQTKAPWIDGRLWREVTGYGIACLRSHLPDFCVLGNGWHSLGVHCDGRMIESLGIHHRNPRTWHQHVQNLDTHFPLGTRGRERFHIVHVPQELFSYGLGCALLRNDCHFAVSETETRINATIWSQDYEIDLGLGSSRITGDGPGEIRQFERGEVIVDHERMTGVIQV